MIPAVFGSIVVDILLDPHLLQDLMQDAITADDREREASYPGAHSHSSLPGTAPRCPAGLVQLRHPDPHLEPRARTDLQFIRYGTFIVMPLCAERTSEERLRFTFNTFCDAFREEYNHSDLPVPISILHSQCHT